MRGNNSKEKRTMRTTLLATTAAAALVLSQAAVMAQTAHDQTPSMKNSANQTTHTKEGMRAQLRDMLQKSGFTDVQVMPGSFIIHAKDKDGNPVVMNVSPDSFTEMTEVVGDYSAERSGTMDHSAAADSPSSRFVSVQSADELSSNVVGLDVYNSDNKNIGQIKDIALNQHGRAQAYILSVGGFLGVGDHYVAVNPSEVKVSYNESDKKWHAAMNATADQLKAAPEFKYTGHWNGSKS
jgi:sporulation protein YlmC with PRC-barrel domain